MSNLGNQNFILAVTTGIQGILSDLLEENGHSLFRRSPRVQLGPALNETSQDFHLILLGAERQEGEAGTFRVPSPGKGFLVYRNPDRVLLRYRLVNRSLPMLQAVDAVDKLMRHFFDHRTVTPFLPSTLASVPGVYERLSRTSADLSLQLDGDLQNSVGGFQLGFKYRALFHTGTLFAAEGAVSSRALHFQDASERV